jgi:hypothetical protein
MTNFVARSADLPLVVCPWSERIHKEMLKWDKMEKKFKKRQLIEELVLSHIMKKELRNLIFNESYGPKYKFITHIFRTKFIHLAITLA